MIKEKKFVIIDGNAIIHRAYHAIPPLSNKDGVMVNAVYGFISMLLKVIEEVSPDYLAVSFDMAGGTFRDKIFADYKAKRVKSDQELYDQIPLIHEAVAAFGIPIFEKVDFEADDVIGTLVKQVQSTNQQTKIQSMIISGDMDLLQLVRGDKVIVRGFKKGFSEMISFNEAAVKEKYGFGPELVVDYKALRGDASDNIPGVPGIGEKTATNLLQKVGNIEKIYSELKNDSDRTEIRNQFSQAVIAKLEKGEKSAKMSYEIATIHSAVPGLNFSLEDCILKPYNLETVLPLLQKFGLVSLVRRLSGGKDENKNKKETVKKNVQKVEMVESGKSEKLILKIKKTGHALIKEVLSGPSVLSSDWLGFVLEVDDEFFYIEWGKITAAERLAWQELFLSKKFVLIGHDLKQFIKAGRFHGLTIGCDLFDTMIASYVLNSGTRAHDLVSIALRELGEELPVSGQSSLFGPDVSTIARELSVVGRVWKTYQTALAKNVDEKVFHEIEMALIPVLAHMELSGVTLDVPYLKKISAEAGTTIELVTKKIWTEAGEEFNVASPVQLRDILYEKMGLKIPGIKKGKTGFSTAASELEKMRGTNPIIELIEEYRELAKLQNTYLEVLPTLINPKTGRIHTSYNQAVAATGRLSSTDPNMQNIPIRTELGKKVREAFVAEPGNELIVADYSQFELRIVASLANDEKLIEIFRVGDDVHKATAAIVNGVAISEVTPEMRRAAKEVNFGVLYGMGVFGLSSRTGITQFEAKDFIAKYFEKFAGVKNYLAETVAKATKDGYVETLFGRRRYIPEIQSENYQLRSAGERMAVNMPVQGTQADLIKMAMISLEKYLEQEYPNSEVKMILQVHDELVFEAPKKLVEKLIPVIKEKMTNVFELKVPIEVQIGVGKNWGQAK